MQDRCSVPPAGSPMLPCSTQGWEHQVGNPALSPLGMPGFHLWLPSGLSKRSSLPEFSSPGKLCYSQTWLLVSSTQGDFKDAHYILSKYG